jgi:hypothetical protein
MNTRNAVAIVANFWSEVWQSPQNPDAIDRLGAENFMITSGGQEIRSRAEFKKWVIEFQKKIIDLEFEVIESFQNEDGTRVASRWRVTGKNNGIMGTVPNQEPIDMTGIAILEVREDGLLQNNWVERSAWEVHGRLTGR